MFASICISSLKNYLISLENLLHDQAFQHDGVMVYAIFFPNTVAQIAADSKTANFGLGILKDTPLIVSFALSQTVNQKGKQKSGLSKASCVSSYPPAPHALFHTTLLQLHVNSLAVSYAFQLTAAGYKPRVIFHEQTL